MSFSRKWRIPTTGLAKMRTWFQLSVVLRLKVKDRQTGEEVKLTEEQIEILQNLKRGKYPEAGYNAYEVASLHSFHMQHANVVMFSRGLTSSPEM